MGRTQFAQPPPNPRGLDLAPLPPRTAAAAARLAAGTAALLAAAWLLAQMPLLWAGAAVALVCAGLLLLRHPWLVWPGLAFALPFASGVDLGPLSVADGILAAAVFFWFAEGVRKRRLRISPGFPSALVALYALTLLLSFTNAVNAQKAIEGVIKWGQTLVVILLIQEALSPRQLRWLVWGLLAGAALQASIGVYQFLFRIGPPNFLLFDRFMRAAGTFGQPNPFAGYLGLTLPAAIALFLHHLGSILRLRRGIGSRGASGRGMNSSHAWTRALLETSAYGALAALIGLGMVSSWSRGGWLGAAASVAVVVLAHSGRKMIAAAIAGGAALLLTGGALTRFIPPSLTERLQDLPVYFGLGMWEVVQQPVTNSNFSVVERLAHWIAALRMWELAPWLGVGPGNYAAVYPQVRLPRWEDPLGHAHNIYLNVLAENGVVGFAAYLLMWGGVVGWLLYQRGRLMRPNAAWTARVDALRWPPNAWSAALLLGVLGVVVHLSVHQLFDYLYVQGIYIHVALWLGAAVALARRPLAQMDLSARRADRMKAVTRRRGGFPATTHSLTWN